jgi:hypothetical protein
VLQVLSSTVPVPGQIEGELAVWKDRLTLVVVAVIYVAAVIAIIHQQGFHPLGQANGDGVISILFR